ncbi:ProQ/FINO family protein [Reinekea marinisedimentorum]|uniref:ProP effector n=1 Tax=Reinekea marinisedimentorum TaxID=230495 RepID=A0A4R3IAP0_9GAMM|nr:ProQ/FinO family protein [Reinekea marinisedimentorum]TCS43044.1 ProP effector [Reinekea marinisedimentorum]
MSEQPAIPQNQEETKLKLEAKRKKEYEANRKALEELCTLYPEVFNTSSPKPLQIGVHKAIAEDGKLSKTRIRRALNLYVRMRRYIACLQEGADRVTIGGESAGVVTAEEAKHAAEKLAEIDKKRAKRKPQPEKPKRRPARKPTSASKAVKPSAKQPAKAAVKAESNENSEERFQAKLAALVNKRTN